jgi:hypothetical protein
MQKIHLPKALYDKLELSETNEEIEVVDFTEDSFTLRTVSAEKESNATIWFIVPTLMALTIFLVFAYHFDVPQFIPLSGSHSIATAIITIANTISIVTFIVAYFQKRHKFYHQMTKRIYWRTFLTVIISVLIIVTLAMMALFWFFGQIFYGANFEIFTASLIFTIFSGILNYLMIFIVETFSIRMMVNMLLMVSVGGLVSSMATNGNQYWWQRNFSLLGTSASKASWQFNLTLIISAALFIALVDYIFVSIREKMGSQIRHIILQTLLTLCAISIGLVGLIPNNPGWMHVAHDYAAQSIVLFMALAILGIRWFLPKVGKNFYIISYVIVAVILICYFLWHPVYYFTLTAFEILSFSLSFAWLLLLVNRLIDMLWNNHKVYRVVVSEEAEQ